MKKFIISANFAPRLCSRQLNYTVCMFICALFTANAQAQDATAVTRPNLRIGIETGFNGFFGETDKPAMIREDRSYYYDYYYGGVSADQEINVFYFGIKPEITLKSYKRFTVAAGVRFSMSKASLDTGYSDSKYFLWKISEDGSSTNYVRINSITQKNYYIGIPFEMRFYVRRKDSFVRQYFSLGTEINFLAASNDKVSFTTDGMKKYTPDVISNIKNPGFFNGLVYAGVGMRVGRANHPMGLVEFFIPAFIFGNGHINSFTKGSAAAGMGFQMTLQIPLFTNKQSNL